MHAVPQGGLPDCSSFASSTLQKRAFTISAMEMPLMAIFRHAGPSCRAVLVHHSLRMARGGPKEEAPATSPNPPVLDHGATSADTKTIFSGVSDAKTAAAHCGIAAGAHACCAPPFPGPREMRAFCRCRATAELKTGLDLTCALLGAAG